MLADSVACWLDVMIRNYHYSSHSSTGVPVITRDYIQQFVSKYGRTECSLRRIYENAFLVTFLYDDYCDGGGAHPLMSTISATFVKSNGKRLEWEIYRDDANFQPILRDGLKSYFGHNHFVDFLRYFDNTIDRIPLPGTPPWIESKGICFHYRLYEIASNADGMPTFVVPMNIAKKILKPKAYELVK